MSRASETSDTPLPRDAESPELWSDAYLVQQVARYLRQWPGRGARSVRLFGAMIAELVERRRAQGETGTDAEIEHRIRGGGAPPAPEKAPKKTPAQLDREIAEIAASTPSAPVASAASGSGPMKAENTETEYTRIRDAGPAFRVDRRFIGRCKRCGASRKLEGRVMLGSWRTQSDYVVRCPDGSVYTTTENGGNTSKVRVRCGDHGLVLHAVVEGTKASKHACGARCTSSTGPNCDCRCRGANHGSGL